MEKTELDWLDRAAGVKTILDQYQKKELKKQLMLREVQAKRNEKLNVLREGAALKVTNRKGEQRQLTDLETRDQLKEFDREEQFEFRLAEGTEKDGVYERSDDELKHLRVRDAVSEQEELMSQATIEEERIDPETGERKMVKVPLFTQEEIAEQVYDPMVREGLMSETFVPDKYSRTQQMLDPVFNEYAERLKRDKKHPALNFLSENQGVLLSSLSMMMTVSSGGIDSKMVDSDKKNAEIKWGPQAFADLKESLVGKDGVIDPLKQGNQVVKLLNQGFALTMDVFKPAVEGIQGAVQGEGEKGTPGKPDLPRLAPGLTMALYSGLCTGLSTGLNDVGVKAALDVVGSFSRQVDKSGLATAVAKRELTGISPLLVKGLTAALTGLKLAPVKTLADDWPKVIVAAGAALQDALDKALAGKALAEALDKLDADAASLALAEAGVAAGKAAATAELAKVLADPAMELAAKAEAQRQMVEEFESPEEGGDSKAHQAAGHDHEPDWVRDPSTKEWVCATCQANQSDKPEVFAGMLERRIAEFKRNQAILDWGAKIAAAGVDVAANFIAPLAAVGGAVKMAKNLVEAGRRTRDLYNFVVKREGLLNAASTFSTAVSNFIVEMRSQMLHYLANAAFEAAKIIGAALQCGGITAPAGFALSTAASFAQSLEAVIYEVAKRMRLEKAWSTYRAFLLRKKNRRMGLEAIKANPTLAKYALAWGAIVKKDPLVVDVLIVCDLTPDTLKDPNANIDQVVTYLEARFGDSSVVTGRQGEFDVGEVKLSRTAWMKLQIEAVKTEKLNDQGTGLIIATLNKWDTDSTTLQTAANAPDQHPLNSVEQQNEEKLRLAKRAEAVALLQQLIRGLTRYQPKTTQGQACLAMVATRDAFRDEANRMLGLVQKWGPP